MIKPVCIIFLLLTFISCQDKPIDFRVGEKLNIEDADKEVVKQWGSGSPRVEIYWLSKEDSIFRRIHYYETGEVSGDFSFVNGKGIEGAEYFKNGKTKGNAPYDKNGLLNGPAKYYYEDGSIRVTCYYKNGEYEGDYICFDDDGKMLWKDTYKNGELIEQTDYHRGTHIVHKQNKQ